MLSPCRDISQNSLTGTLPPSWSELAELLKWCAAVHFHGTAPSTSCQEAKGALGVFLDHMQRARLILLTGSRFSEACDWLTVMATARYVLLLPPLPFLSNIAVSHSLTSFCAGMSGQTHCRAHCLSSTRSWTRRPTCECQPTSSVV